MQNNSFGGCLTTSGTHTVDPKGARAIIINDLRDQDKVLNKKRKKEVNAWQSSRPRGTNDRTRSRSGKLIFPARLTSISSVCLLVSSSDLLLISFPKELRLIPPKRKLNSTVEKHVVNDRS